MPIINTILNEKKLIICPYCNGYGQTRELTRRGPIIKARENICETCKGSGKLWQQTTITTEPYIPNKNYYKQL